LSNIPVSEEDRFFTLIGFPQEIPDFPGQVKQAFFSLTRDQSPKKAKNTHRTRMWRFTVEDFCRG
jgi:hypothetical protein